MRKLFEEVKRRNVFRVAFVYIVAAWLTMQVVDVMFPALQVPEWVTPAIAVMLLIGFPFALILAWAFEITPDGIKLEKDVDRDESVTPHTGQKLNQTAIIILVVAVGFLLFDKFVLRPKSAEVQPQVAGEAREVVQTIKPSIAVLPFVNMSGDIENEYFSDGLSEELLNVLAKIPQLHVAGRTSSFAFKGKNEDLREIGEQLDVAHILEGSVRKSNTRLRITAQLIDTENGYHLWSETYDREITDVFAVQDEISNAVVTALKVALLGDAIQTDHGTENLEAYELYLKARYLEVHTSADNLLAAIDALDQAIALDPNYAPAYVLRAITEIEVVSGWASSGSEFLSGFERGREFAAKAIELAPDSAESVFVQGVIATSVDWDFVAAQQYFKEAIALEPNHVPAMLWYGNVLYSVGRPEDAVAMFEKALEIDPLSISATRDLGDAHLFSGDVEEAIRIYSKILDLNNSVSRVYGRLARAALIMNDSDAAMRYVELEEIEWVRGFINVLVLGRRGMTDEWRAAAEEYKERWGNLNAFQFAEIYADAGEIDEAFKWLDVARDVHDPGAVIAKIDHFLEPLHDDPRWPVFLESMGLSD